MTIRERDAVAIEIRADVRGDATPLAHFWSACVGAGRANEGLRAGWLEQMATAVAHCGFRYVRFHGLFHDDMFVYRVNERGESIYNFQYVDELFDRLLAIDVRPFVEFGFCPGDLARERGTVFWWRGNGSPPTDVTKWGELVGRTVAHWAERYGLDEVRRWYFEVWNEPNLRPFFRGTKSEYFEMYRHAARAVKQVDAALRVGGPATSNFVPDARFAGETEDVGQHGVVTGAADLDALDWRPVWLDDFLAFCRRESLPVDFVSCHPYPTDWALDATGGTVKSTRGVDATRVDLARVRAIVDASPFPRAEIHCTEWSSSPSPRDHTHDHVQAATFVVKANVESVGLVDSLSYWTFTDVFEEGGAGDAAFHGGFGMINYQGVPKPAFHAYRMLNALGDELLARGPGFIATRRAGRLAAIAYHYPPEVTLSVPASFDSRDVAEQTLATGGPTALRVDVAGVAPGATVVVETLDAAHGNAIAAWHALGAPPSPTREQVERLKRAALATRVESVRADAEGRVRIDRTIEPWAVVLVRET